MKNLGIFLSASLVVIACSGEKSNQQADEAVIEGKTLSSAVDLALNAAFLANPVVFEQWKSGNAIFECSQIGNYTYALKINEGDGKDEGAPNGSETAKFYDSDDNLVHSNTITISNSDGKSFDWSSSNSIGAVIVKAATGANVSFYEPQAFSDTGLYGYSDKDISHVTFCWNPDEVIQKVAWCSPGYWRQPHHLDSWDATGYSTGDLFSVANGYYFILSRQGIRQGATQDPTLLYVLQYPQYYGGDAFNAVGDLLSDAHPDVNYLGERVEDSCPLN